MIEVKCRECELVLRAKKESAGKQVKCPKCRTIIHIPDSEVYATQQDDKKVVAASRNNDKKQKKVSRTEKKKSIGWAIASLACGIFSITSSWFILLGLPLGICAIVFYALQKRNSPHGMATGGLVTGISGVILSVTVGGCLLALGMQFSSQEPMSVEVYNQIRTGMTMEEVRSIAGEPNDILSSDAQFGGMRMGTEVWQYGPLDEMVTITFTNGTVSMKMRM